MITWRTHPNGHPGTLTGTSQCGRLADRLADTSIWWERVRFSWWTLLV